jgi:2-desacetyl-2-hydroxyethyl bacteriochlorophyllide A dehydrogenase
MRAVRFADGEAKVVAAEPTLPEYATDPVTVHVKSCSICGSDLHLLNWGLPCIVGHEFAGVLDDGTAVAVQPYVPCGVCDQCRIGETARCRVWLERFHGVSIDGGLADEVIVDRACLAVLPPEVAIENAALTEPLAVTVRAANNAGLTGAREGDGPVLVIGGGSIGLAMTAVLRHRGYQVDVAARHDAQRAAAEWLGAGLTTADEYAVVVDAAGTQGAVDEAVLRLAPGGTLAVVATYWDPVEIGFSLLSKEARIVPSSIYGHHNGRREFEDAVDILAANPVIAEVLVTHRYGLDEAAEAFRTAGNRADGAIKVIVQP